MKKSKQIVDAALKQPAALPKFASILIVDDQRFDRKRLRRLCGQLDFETLLVEADTLESMGTALQRDRFDLVILDYNLPDGTGLDAIPAIRRHNEHRQTAIIMITGQNEAGIAIEAMKQGCSDYIDKNVLSLEALRRASVNALQKSALTAGLEAQELMRKRVETVLQGFTRECVLEIKPMLSRMMRQMRNLSDGNGTINPQTMNELDTSCMRLWEFLTDLESFDGKEIVDREFARSKTPMANARPAAKSARAKQRNDGPEAKPKPRPGRSAVTSGRLFSKHARPASPS